VEEVVSRSYAVLQTLLLSAFAIVYFVGSGTRLLPASRTIGSIGLVLCGAGLLLMLAAFRSLGSAIQIAPEPRAGAELVTRGIYRWLRHPIYSAIVFVVLGLFLRKPTGLVAISAAVAIVFLVVKSRYEETRLIARYPQYAAYRERTTGVIPWFRRPRVIRSNEL
jgi:protein-S-isoprenylcysteine O-methyltransferase Ste14